MDKTHITTHRVLRLSALSAALLSAFGPARGQDDPEISALTKPNSSISVGAGSWNNGRPQQGIYDGMRDQGVYGVLDADVTKRNEETGTWLNFRGRNLGLDTRELRGEYSRQGLYGIFLEYDKSVRENPYTITTGLQGIGTPNLTIGTNLGAFPLREVELGTSREMMRIGGFKNLMPGLDFKFDFKNEEKQGTRQTGWGSAALFSVEPVDSTIQQLDAILQYTADRFQLSGGYAGSWYDNRNKQILQQLNGTTGGAANFGAVTPLSQPLSNAAHQLFMDGGYAFTPTTRGTIKLAYTVATQDDRLPSYDLGGANAPFVNAPSHLDGRIQTTLVQLGLSSRPLPKLALTGNLRYYDLNDKTPLAGYVGNNTTGVATVFNTPHSYTTRSGKFDATYRLPAKFSVTGGLDYVDQNRSAPTIGNVYVPFRQELTEITYRAQLRRSMGENMNGSLAYLRSDRDGSDYLAANGTSPYSNQINPLHIADRERDKWRAQFDWDPTDKLSLQFRLDHSSDRYPSGDRPYGPQKGSAQVYAVDVSYAFSEDWVLTAWYARDMTKARSLGYRQSASGPANAIREADLQDKGDSLGLSMRAKLSARLEGGVGVDWFRSTSRYAQDIELLNAGTAYPNGTGGPLPDVHTNLLRFKFDAKYALDKASDLRFDLIFERWRSDDWSWEFANGDPFRYYSGAQGCAIATPCSGGYTGVVDGTTVTARDKQISTFVGIRYTYKFQ